jgi:hypothetical protein
MRRLGGAPHQVKKSAQPHEVAERFLLPSHWGYGFYWKIRDRASISKNSEHQKVRGDLLYSW